jgi:precorrin-6Y C5,15-methyltransferase (decarboxylating)
VGLDGQAGLSPATLALIHQAVLLVGSPRHLSYFPDVEAEVWPLDDLKPTLERLHQWLNEQPVGIAVVLTSGDPLFFGLGRLLLAHLPPESLTFYPHVSAIQLAFSRLKLPWQGATLISAHGRSADELLAALRQGDELIAVLTDPTHTPAVIGEMILSLELPYTYRLWVCENLGSEVEAIHPTTPEAVIGQAFATLNVVVLQRSPWPLPVPNSLPRLGLPDAIFAGFRDRPGLMTKRDIRIQILADLALQDGQIIWDIGAGTGSVSIEISRLCSGAQVYAIEKTLAGLTLIEENKQRFGTANLYPIYGTAPQVLAPLPDPNRIFIGGSGGQLPSLLTACTRRLCPGGQIVLALATLEHLSTALTWVEETKSKNVPNTSAWLTSLRQLQVQHSVSVGLLTRWQPLTPITLMTLTHQPIPG